MLKRVVPWLWLIASFGLAGLLGKVLDAVAGVAARGTGSVALAIGGVAIPWLLALYLTIHLIVHLNPLKGGKGPAKSTRWVALIWAPVTALAGGVFLQALGLAEQGSKHFGPVAVQFVNELFRSF